MRVRFYVASILLVKQMLLVALAAYPPLTATTLRIFRLVALSLDLSITTTTLRRGIPSLYLPTFARNLMMLQQRPLGPPTLR